MSITRDGFSNELLQDKQQEIMLDSNISQSRHIEAERGLARWVPDEDVPQCPGVDNIFDGTWNRLLPQPFLSLSGFFGGVRVGGWGVVGGTGLAMTSELCLQFLIPDCELSCTQYLYSTIFKHPGHLIASSGSYTVCFVYEM